MPNPTPIFGFCSVRSGVFRPFDVFDNELSLSFWPDIPIPWRLRFKEARFERRFERLRVEFALGVSSFSSIGFPPLGGLSSRLMDRLEGEKLKDMEDAVEEARPLPLFAGVSRSKRVGAGCNTLVVGLAFAFVLRCMPIF
jgi:hypothetical protein